MLRIYLSKEILDLSNNNIYDLELINDKIIKKFKFEETIKYRHQQYKNINRNICSNNITTYVEYFEYYTNINNYIILKYTKNILNNNEFPLLHKYDIDEEITIDIYKFKNIKLIKNKNFCFFEVNEIDLKLLIKIIN
jgi:hypothetical protein